MLSSLFTLFSTSLFFVLTHALPTTISQTNINLRRQDNESEPKTETWLIPNLAMHMMSTNTGLPGNSWPPSLQFNSTIAFDIVLPTHNTNSTNSTDGANGSDTTTVACGASFPNGTLPLGLQYCSSPSSNTSLFFELYPYTSLGPRRPELSFYLDLTAALNWNEENRTADTFWWGRTPVTANDPSEESSYLTCLEGAPLDGLRCQIGGLLSRRQALVVNVEEISGKIENDSRTKRPWNEEEDDGEDEGKAGGTSQRKREPMLWEKKVWE